MKYFLSLAIVTALAALAPAAEKTLTWPQFRGPGASGVADGQKPPVEFGPDKNVKWKVAVPSGISSPIVAGDNLVITALEDGKLYTIAYRRSDGKEAWRAEAPVKQLELFHKTEGSPAASTSATDGKRIVSYFGSCGLVCYDLTGKELWKHTMEPAATAGSFGSGVSPIVSDGVVVLVRDQTKESKIIALDAETGSLKWEKKRLSPTSYSTPVIWDTPAGKQVVVAGHAVMIGYDLKTGDEKWTLGGIPSACCSSPVVADGVLLFAGFAGGGSEDKEFAMPPFDAFLKDLDTDKDGAISRDEGAAAFGGFFDNQDADKDGRVEREEWDAITKFMSEGKNIAFALKPGATGNVTDSQLLWKQSKGLPYIPSALAYRGQYVMVKDGGVVTAYDVKTGAQVYQARVAAPGTYYASPVAANGHIYFTTLSDGTVTVIKAGGGEAKVVATNPKLGERTSATPAIADDTLYIRTEKHLYAFTDKDKARQ